MFGLNALICNLILIFLSFHEPKAIQETSVAEKGKASYYAAKFNGRRTASGEKFYIDSLTAAHKTLPFGTIVKVTNLINNTFVQVKINDRLPKHSKRAIDLSPAAAGQLNFIKKGIVPVAIEVIKLPL